MHLFRTACLFIFLVLGAGGLFAEGNTTKISAAEYFVDTDPGEGSGTALTAQDGAFDSEVEAIAPVDLNVTGLSVGPHLIGIRYKDDNNTWGDVLYQTIHVYDANPSGSGSGGSGGGGSGGSSVGFATITAAEYFVDTDPGEGSGNAFQPKDGAFDSEVEAILPKDLNVTGLSVGPHLIGIRYKDNNNTWGDVLYQTIHVYDANPSGSGSGGSGGGGSGGSSVSFATITAAEYFVDTDPGEGSGNAFQPKDGAFDSEVEAILPKDLNVTGLSVGPHLVGVRYKDNNNTWGDVLYQTIHVYDANPSGSGSGGSVGGGSGGSSVGFASIAGAEYFIGTDPGEGNATALQPKDGAFDSEVESTLAVNLSLDGYAIGSYLVGVRYKDNHGTWGDVLFKTVEVDVDTDGDGLADKAEAYYETNSTLADTDGDGYSDGEEVAFGSDPTDPSSLGNQAPRDLNSTAVLALQENQPVGTIIGELNATDPDGHAITYHFVNGENNNSLFTLDTNGTVKTATTFDYESNASSYTITVQAKDEHNAFIEGNFTVTLQDVFEDLDQDGTEDHYDDDMDGDGFTNAEELAYGSDPRSAATLPLNDSNFMSAINLWFDAERNATALYGHISDWNVSAVTTMVRAFENRTSFNEDIGNWDISQVTQTNSMFRGATTFNQPIGDWNFSNVSLTSNMFHDASSFNQPIGKWDVSQVTNMTNMFKGAIVFNQPIGGWNVSSVTSMGSMFYDAKAFNQPIGNWDFSKVTMMNSMFRGASSFNQAIGDWNVSATTNMAALFYDASNFDQAIGNWDVSRVSSMMNMFRGATAFNQPIGDWNVSAVSSMASVFYDAKAFNQSLGQWDVSGATVMNSMFRGASSFNQSIEDWDISQVTNTNGMFGGADNLENITKRKIHKAFSSNQNWEYDWRPHLANSSPIDLNATTDLTLNENDPVGTMVSKFNATDLEGDAITFSLTKSEGNDAPYPFQMEQNGTLRAAKSFDYETDEHNYTITVVAKDEYNATTEGNFTVTLLNVMEDLDQDGIEDHFDDDMDGDGVSNVDEIAHGSDPKDSSSVADTQPTSITLSTLEIVENQPVGSIVGKFTVIAPNSDDVHRVMFSQLDGNGTQNHLFSIDSNNTLRTAAIFDFEKNSSDLVLRVKARQGQVDVLWESFTLSLMNDPTDDGVTDNNGTQPFVDRNESTDNNTTQHPIHDGNDTVDGNYTPPTWDDHNNTQDDNGTLPPVSGPDTDQVINPYAWIPIIHTDHPQMLDDGRIQLSGRVLYDDGGTMSEFGFLLSPTLHIPLNSPDTLKLEANGTADSFTLIIPESPYPRRLYVQAYSTNEAGMGLGQRRRLKIPEPSVKWWGEAIQGEGGWLQSPWFGAFKYYEQGWLYHAELGWLYSSPAEDGVWLWGSDNQWLWTKDGIYPYHYRWDDAAWGIWQKSANGSIRTYNYGTGNYEN
jgi:surface protein